MRQVMMITVLAVGAMTAFPTFSAHGQALECVRGRGCVPTTQPSYNACFRLALARGESVTVGEYRNLNWFIYQFLAGKIPRQSDFTCSTEWLCLRPAHPGRSTSGIR